ncbi:MAG: hypothetical protein K0S32_2585 [Bacteroidetes bacterium]|jgi:ferric-dicitrate binding protein FerR (iron transport regulator)|nr:hypothetical protein [Bacteroidota bacterium]
MNEGEETLLARWLSNELTAEEKRKLEESGEAETLRRIVASMETWTLPDLAEETYSDIKSKLDSESEAKVIPLYQRRSFLAIAASLLLLVGLFFLLRPMMTSQAAMTDFACNAGETKELKLPDNTNIILYGKSKISYDKENFASDRKLKLEGEAYFEVNTKGAFEVDFANGKVNVLGTKFNVLTSSEEASVKCFEGKVKVEVENNSAVLVPGQGARKTKTGNFTEFEFKANILPGAGAFRNIENTPLEEVCNTLSVFYDVKIINENVDLSRKFSGQMNQQNLDTALTMIFVPMDITFVRNQSTITIKNK